MFLTGRDLVASGRDTSGRSSHPLIGGSLRQRERERERERERKRQRERERWMVVAVAAVLLVVSLCGVGGGWRDLIGGSLLSASTPRTRM